MRRLVVAATAALVTCLAAPALARPPAEDRECRPTGHGNGHGNGRGHGHDHHDHDGDGDCDEDDGGEPEEGDGGGPGGLGGGPGAGGGGPTGGAPNAAGAGPSGAPAQDVAAPSFSRPTLRPSRFRAARRGPAIAVAVGTRVRYRLSEPARVRFTVLRARLTVRRCRTHASRLAHASRHRRCLRYRRVSRFTHSGIAGGNSFRFRGRAKGRRLRPGRYRLLARATDASGNRSLSRRVRFDIVP